MPLLERPFFNFSVIRAPLREVLTAFDGSAAMRHRGLRPAETPFRVPQQGHGFDPVDPLLLWAASNAPHLTGFIPHIGSGDYFVCEYASALGFGLVQVRSTADGVDESINEFACREDPTRKRLVRAMKDDPKWQFFEEGSPLPFEDLAAYRRPRIRDRFTRRMLLDYVEAWGAPVLDPRFWRPAGSAFTIDGTPAGAPVHATRAAPPDGR